MVWGACGFGAPTGQTIRWQLELLLLKTHLCRGFQLYTGPVIFWFESLEEALALAVVWEEVIVHSRKRAPSVSQVLLLSWGACVHPKHSWNLGSSLGCPTMKPVPIPSIWGGVCSPLDFLQVKILPLVGKCFSISVRVGQTPWKKSLCFWRKYLYLFGFFLFFFFP